MNLILHKRGKLHRTSSIEVESNDIRTGRKLEPVDIQKRAQRRWGPGTLVPVDETGWKWEYVTR